MKWTFKKTVLIVLVMSESSRKYVRSGSGTLSLKHEDKHKIDEQIRSIHSQ